jgi:hypothetical protein
MTCDNMFVVLLKSFLNYYQVMDFVEGAMLLAIGFLSTLIALEIVYRMGRAIGKRGEISSLAQHGKLKMLFS